MFYTTRILAIIAAYFTSTFAVYASDEVGLGPAPVPAKGFAGCTPNTIGGMLSNLSSTLGPVGYGMLGITSAFIGLVLVLWGLINLTKENAQERRLFLQLSRILGGGVLVSITTQMHLASSLFGFSHTAEQYRIDAVARAVSGCGTKQTSANDLAGTLTNFMADSGGPLMVMVIVMAFISGMFFISASIIGLIQNASGQHQQKTLSALLMRFGAGAMLINFAAVFAVIDTTLLGTGDIAQFSVEGCSSLSYKNDPLYTIKTQSERAVECINGVRKDASPEAYAAATINAIYVFLIPFGALSMLSGTWILANIGNGKSQLGYKHAFTRIIAGAILINLASYSCLLGNTLGISSNSSMSKYTVNFCKD